MAITMTAEHFCSCSRQFGNNRMLEYKSSQICDLRDNLRRCLLQAFTYHPEAQRLGFQSLNVSRRWPSSGPSVGLKPPPDLILDPTQRQPYVFSQAMVSASGVPILMRGPSLPPLTAENVDAVVHLHQQDLLCRLQRSDGRVEGSSGQAPQDRRQVRPLHLPLRDSREGYEV